MLASNLELLRHISDEVDFILNTINNKTKEEVLNNGILCRALVRSLEIMGEAAKKMNDEFKGRYPYIEWKKMAGTRDKLIHDYFGVDYDIVWSIVETKLPALKEFIDTIINETEL